LSKHQDLVPVAERVADRVRARFVTEMDITGSVGKRYRRQDEVGTPYCVTVDFESLDDHQVTIRERDSMDQERVPIDALPEHLAKRFEH
jgi:glycyl-tRNA synthetase